MFYLTMHSTHFIYGYMTSDIWLRTILILRKETHCCHIGYSFRLTARVLLYAPSHRQDNSYHSLNGFTPRRIDLMTHHTMSERYYHGATSRSCLWQVLKLCPSPSMTSRFFITITSTKKIMILQLIVVKYYYS